MGITKETMDKIKAMHDSGYTFVEIAKKLNIPESVVRHICRN